MTGKQNPRANGANGVEGVLVHGYDRKPPALTGQMASKASWSMGTTGNPRARGGKLSGATDL